MEREHGPFGKDAAGGAAGPRAALREEEILAGDLLPAPPESRPRSVFRRTALFVTGVLVFLAGVVLGILPIVPGFPLMIAGALMMAAGSSVTRSLLNHAEIRLPRRWRVALRTLLRRTIDHRRVP